MDVPAPTGVVELDEFIAANLISFAAWDLLVYLHKHPAVDASVPQLCSALTRTTSEMERALDRFAMTGLVEPRRDGDVVRYRLTSDARQRSGLEAFAEAARDRGERLELVRHVMGLIAL